MASSWRVQQELRRCPTQGMVICTDRHPLISYLDENRRSLGLAFDGVDPLSQFAHEKGLEMEGADQKDGHGESEAWAARRSGILNRFRTERYIYGAENARTQSTIADKMKQLDEVDDGSTEVSQEEFVQKIELLREELIKAWNNDHRVNSLKIAIQCSKLLGETSVEFYPRQFVLITDILDLFGRLVYDRLKEKSGYVKPGTNHEADLPDNFTPEMVPEPAKETCQNWFYKIASIRELLPRFYIEAAILKCYNFLDKHELDRALIRLTGICRGFGDPLVEFYARCFLCRVGLDLSTEYRYLLENVNDTLKIYHTIFNNGTRAELMRKNIEIHSYLTLYIPAINWLLLGLSATAPFSTQEDVFHRCCEQKHSALLMHCLIASFPKDFIAGQATKVLNTMFLHASIEEIVKFNLMRQLGEVLAEKPISKEDRLVIFEGALKFITGLKDPKDYTACIEPWAEFTAKNFPLKQVNFIINDLLSHMTPNRVFMDFLAEILSVMERIVSNLADFEGLLTMDNFLPVIDLFPKESYRVDLCKHILNVFRAREAKGTISDPVLINNLMFLCRILNDSVSALTGDDERRQISWLVSHFIRQVAFGRDFQAQLAFYAEARAAFLNLPEVVYATLVTCVVRLMCDMRGCLKQQGHTKKTHAFAKACAAFCFITIPSIECVQRQMDLYYLVGAAALVNDCLGQADACFHAAILLVPRLAEAGVGPRDGESRPADLYLLSYTPRLLNVLIWTPDSPDYSMLHLPNLLMERVGEFPLENKASAAAVHMHFLDFYSAIGQEVLPNRIPGLISNDRLYGCDPKFVREVEQTCDKIVGHLLEQLQALGMGGQGRLQAAAALELFQRIVFKSDLSEEAQFTLAGNLWSLAMKNRAVLGDSQWPIRIVEGVRAGSDGRGGEKAGVGDQESLKKLLVKMQRKL